MNPLSLRFRQLRTPVRAVILVLVVLQMASSLQAFPPAPYYTLYGTVRDQVGQSLNTDGAQIILLNGTTEVGRTPITTGAKLDQDYELNVRLDMMRTGTVTYSDNAIKSQGQFSIVVEMNGQRYYPIEASGPLTAGKGGERVRLDLNLGEDLDHDGLPDVWEAWQLYQAGYSPDADGKWALNLIDRDGDFDHDGRSNWQEYLAGTFAGDATEKFDLAIKEKTVSGVRFEFYAITGKTYTIEHSADLKTWARISFGVETAARDVSFKSPDVGIKSAFATPATEGKEFYRLTVR